MSIYHDEVEIEDMEFDEETETYYFPCPCGDKFSITKVVVHFDFWALHVMNCAMLTNLGNSENGYFQYRRQNRKNRSKCFARKERQ